MITISTILIISFVITIHQLVAKLIDRYTYTIY